MTATASTDETMSEHAASDGDESTARVAADIDAERSASSHCCCGRPLPAQQTGRKKRTCSPSCRRRRDGILRKVRRREAWLLLWRALAGGNSSYSAAHVQAEVDTLEREIGALLSMLESGGTERDEQELRSLPVHTEGQRHADET